MTMNLRRVIYILAIYFIGILVMPISAVAQFGGTNTENVAPGIHSKICTSGLHFFYAALFHKQNLANIRQPVFFAAGDENLTAFQLIEDKILPCHVQLTEDVVQKQYRYFAGVLPEYLPRGQLQGNGRRPGLPLRAEAL